MTEIASAAVVVNQSEAVTLIISQQPATVGKVYDFQNGALTKRPVANVTQGRAISYDARTADEMVALLKFAAASTDCVVCPSIWNGDVDPDGFEITTESALARLMNLPLGSPALGGVQNIDGRLIAARLRRGLIASVWILLDGDNPPGMPEAWRAYSVGQRIEQWSRFVPGLEQCERIEMRGSSARVRLESDPPRQATHAWLRISNPEMLATLKAFLGVQMVILGVSFPSPRHSRTTGEVIGHVHRGVFDLAVLDAGRLVFCSRPNLTDAAAAAGYVVDDANIVIVNPGGGALDVSGIGMPSPVDLSEYRRITGEAVSFQESNGALSVRSAGVLILNSEIEVRGTVQTFGAWLARMRDGETVRCEAPFRASTSEAAFMRRTGPGEGFVFDIGNSTTYTLDAAAVQDARIDAATAVGQRLREVAPELAVAADRGRVLREDREERGRARTEARQAADARQAATLEAVRGDREEVLADEGIEHLVVARMAEELPALSVPVFSHAGGLAYVSRQRSLPVWRGVERLDVTAIGVVPVRPEWLTVQLSERLAFIRTRGRGFVAVDVPMKLVKSLLATTIESVPLLAGIISTPSLRRDGSLMTENGFDTVTGFWLDHDVTLDIMDAPTREDALGALASLRDLLREFPFNEDRDEAVAVAALMSAVLRPAFDTMPGVLIDASAAGSGKSYLTSLIGLLAHGKEQPVSTWPAGEEFEKQLNAMLLAGSPYIAFDNANAIEITGDKICSMLTQTSLKLRPLGRSEDVTVSTAGMMLVVNGNRIHAKEDAAQRFIKCYLNPDDENPRTRRFAADPLDMMRRDRGTYISDVLTIAQAYIGAGRPGRMGYGSFDQWAALVPSALAWLGMGDVLASTLEATADDPERQRIIEVLSTVAGRIAVGTPFTVKEMVATMNTALTDLAALGGLVGARSAATGLPTPNVIADAVGRFFRYVARDRVVTLPERGKVRLEAAGRTRNGALQWQITRL